MYDYVSYIVPCDTCKGTGRVYPSCFCCPEQCPACREHNPFTDKYEAFGYKTITERATEEVVRRLGLPHAHFNLPKQMPLDV
jgi:hypothetical protein